MLEINQQTARRYVLGQQGVWPGRRWSGLSGVENAIHAAGAIQVDTISVVARNHHLALWSRVLDYQPDWLDQVLYIERKFFEYGGIMFIYPLDELPYWWPVMRRSRPWFENALRTMPEVIEHVRERIASEGPQASRDFKDRVRISGGFNTIKDTSHALEYLWRSGQLMVHSRRGFDRVFDLTERLLGKHHLQLAPVSLQEAEDFFIDKILGDLAVASATELSRRVSCITTLTEGPGEINRRLKKMLADGTISQIKLEDRKEILYYRTADTPLLEQLSRGEAPATWQPLSATTETEVNLLAPLDNIIWDKARVKSLFEFDYLREFYKPTEQRRWGYYTMPILYGDQLVARIDPKLDRKSGHLRLQGFWLDYPALAEDPAFGQALATGLERFARFHAATSFDFSAISYPVLQTAVSQRLGDLAPIGSP